MQQLRQMVDTNITAMALVTRLFSPGMVQRNRGHIINISSVAAHHAYPGWLHHLLVAVFLLHVCDAHCQSVCQCYVIVNTHTVYTCLHTLYACASSEEAMSDVLCILKQTKSCNIAM